MALLEYVASQLRKPSGLIGSLVVSRVLNRANVAVNQLTLRLLDLKPGEQVLEVGFGGGDLLKRMIPLVGAGRIAGVDFSPEMVEACTRRFDQPIRTGRMQLRCAGAENLPYGSEAFTKACTVNTVYFWPDPLQPLRELHRVLRDGGRLIVAFSPRTTLQRAPFTKYGFRLYDPEQVQRMLEETGFADVRLVPGSSRVEEFLCAVATKR